MNIKAARLAFDCRKEISEALGPAKANGKWLCPFHSESTASMAVYRDGYHCFGCGAHGDIFDWFAAWHKRPLIDVLKEHRIDPNEEEKRKQEYAEFLKKDSAARRERIDLALQRLRSEKLWLKYAGGQRKLWLEERGIPQWYQREMILGGTEDKSFWADNVEYASATLAFPVFNFLGDVINIRHRILDEKIAKSVGKYRPEYSDLPAPVYLCNPKLPGTTRTIIVEGEIKAMVTYVTLERTDVQVIGLAGAGNFARPKQSLLDLLAPTKTIYLVPDPGVNFMPLARMLGKKKISVVFLNDKIDDLIREYSLDSRWLANILNRAEPWLT